VVSVIARFSKPWLLSIGNFRPSTSTQLVDIRGKDDS